MRISSLSLALVLAFAVGCPGDEGGTDTTATTAGTAMTASTMSAGTAMTASTMSAGSTGTDGTSTENPTTGTPAGGYCGKGCAEPADCCFEGVPNCPGDYPNNWTCDGGVCGAPQCSNDDECTFGGVLPNNKCLDFNGFKACLGTCTSDADCMAPLTCSGTDDGGANKFCFSDATGEGCKSDDDCMGNGKCNTATGACECSADADCTGQGGDKCVM